MMKRLSFRHGTPHMPILATDIIGNLPEHFKPIEPTHFDDAATKDFISRLFKGPRRRRNLESGGRYPSVLALLRSTEDLSALHNWQEKKIQEMGLQNFIKFMDNRRKSGQRFHEMVELLLKELQQNAKISEGLCNMVLYAKTDRSERGYIEGIIPYLKTIPRTDWMQIEQLASNNNCCYHGRFDAIVDIDGKPTLVDWKTVSSMSIKHGGVNCLSQLHSEPCQVAMYITAVNTDPNFASLPEIKQGAVVFVYDDARPPDTLLITEKDLQKYQKIIAQKINKFWWNMMHATEKEKDERGHVNFIHNPNN